MPCVRKDQDREQLEGELESGEYRALLRLLQSRHHFPNRFRSWGDVLTFMREGSSQDPRKDEVLRPLFLAHTEDRNPRWRTILLAIFWPGLKSICIQRRGWDLEFETLWGNAVWAFLQTVCRLDVVKRPDRLVQKIINDTLSRLRIDYERERKHSSREVSTDPELIEDMAGGGGEIDINAIDLRSKQETETNRFREHFQAGRIDETDFHLLVGTLVYGRLVRECGEEVGMTFQAAKKRRQRALAAICRFEEAR